MVLACGPGGGRADRIQDPGTTPPFRLEEVVSGLDSPVGLTAPAGDGRLFIAEQRGRIRIVEAGQLVPVPFLDITDRVRSGGERGLLGLAFHPRFAENGYFFVDYTDASGDTRVERYRVGANAGVADPASATLVLTVSQPYSNHNGGQLAFGPDGYLYIGLGDGGSGGDPQGNGQNPGTLLGALLRIDVDGTPPYSIPADNPFADGAGGRPEIWAWGLRNPWRFSFDRETRELYIGDVGQNQWEEVDVAPAGAGGRNYGWNVREGVHCYGASNCATSGLTDPVLEYDHSQGCSITGGFVYRGARIPAIAGIYFYSDWCGGWIRSFRFRNGVADERRDWNLPDIGRVSSFGQDAESELYVLTDRGIVYRFTPAG